MKIDIKYFNQKVKITTVDGKEFIGDFIDTFEEWNEILVGAALINLDDIKKIELVDNQENLSK